MYNRMLSERAATETIGHQLLGYRGLGRLLLHLFCVIRSLYITRYSLRREREGRCGEGMGEVDEEVDEKANGVCSGGRELRED